MTLALFSLRAWQEGKEESLTEGPPPIAFHLHTTSEQMQETELLPGLAVPLLG